jgi:hypothetical protein
MQIIGVEMSPLKIKKNARLYLRALLIRTVIRYTIPISTGMYIIVTIIHISQHNITGQFMVIAALMIANAIRPMITNIALVLSDIRNVVSYTKKEGSTWLPVWAREA